MSRKRMCSPHLEVPLQRTREHLITNPVITAAPEPLSNRSGRKLQTPNTPFMLQLLVSKHIPEKVESVNCSRLCSSQAPSCSEHKEVSKSVLRNLLVSGHDESEGHYVLPPSSCLDSDSTQNPQLSTHQSSDTGNVTKKLPMKSEPSSGLSSPVVRCTSRYMKRSTASPSSSSVNSIRSSPVQFTKGYRKIIPSNLLKVPVASSASRTTKQVPLSVRKPACTENSFIRCKVQSPAVCVSANCVPSFSVDSSPMTGYDSSTFHEQPTYFLRETDTVPGGSIPSYARRTNSGDLRLVRLTTHKTESKNVTRASPRRSHPPNLLRYANVLPKVYWLLVMPASYLHANKKVEPNWT